MNFKFQVGDLVKVRPNDIGLVTARKHLLAAASGPNVRWAEYTILIGGIPTIAWEYELTKVS